MNKITAGNKGLAKVAVQCSADTFMVNQSLVLCINICGENRQLLVAANLYKQANSRHNNEQTDDFKHKMKR
ncbi:MAG: hypothetical protein Q7W45_07910 [Bacteroidota bacterium]|nr:hypothetical protein [Bacteroidota bacterium]MDP3145981.1 hypothetical protein [Bacteroidota bacterium]